MSAKRLGVWGGIQRNRIQRTEVGVADRRLKLRKPVVPQQLRQPHDGGGVHIHPPAEFPRGREGRELGIVLDVGNNRALLARETDRVHLVRPTRPVHDHNGVRHVALLLKTAHLPGQTVSLGGGSIPIGWFVAETVRRPAAIALPAAIAALRALHHSVTWGPASHVNAHGFYHIESKRAPGKRKFARKRGA